MKIHHLKSWPSEFGRVRYGVKRHEVRRFDRGYEIGDSIILQEFDPVTLKYTGSADLCLLITDITKPGTFGLPVDIGVLSVVDVGRSD